MGGEDVTQGAAVNEPLPTTELAPTPGPGQPMAYSDHTSSVPVVDYQPPNARTAWIVGLVLAAAVAVAAATFFLGRATDDNPQAAPSASTPTTTSTQRPAPAPAPAVPTPDDAFKASLRDHGIASDNPMVMQRWMEFGHHVCYAFSPPQPQEFAAVTGAMVNAENNHSADAMPKFSMTDAANLVRAATMAYCPELSGAVSGDVEATPNAAPAPAVAPAPAAASPSVDDRYWSALGAAGLTSNSKAGSIGQGHQICALLDEGNSYRDVMGQMGMTARVSAGIIRTAVSVLCPSHAGELP